MRKLNTYIKRRATELTTNFLGCLAASIRSDTLESETHCA